jgi:ketosteroid isomerase-like protein
MENHPNQQIIEQLYSSFQAGDAAGMVACYHPEATFEDPAFGKLHGQEVGQMWTMLLERAKGHLDITYSDIRAGDEYGAAYWEAKYPFSRTGRPVHNKIHSHFIFKDGKIFEQKDTFSLWQWASMALGLPGKLLGFMPFFRKKIQEQSRGMLRRYMEGKS